MKKWMVLAGWVLLSQVTYEHCTGNDCRPQGPQVAQRLQGQPSLAACEARKLQMEQATAHSQGQLQPAVEVRSEGSTLRQYHTFRCQEER